VKSVTGHQELEDVPTAYSGSLFFKSCMKSTSRSSRFRALQPKYQFKTFIFSAE